ncbi:MAG: nucleotide sugar dehydrogenase [Thermoanaerobaculia bacterium]|nr:nucleotide sugar dehydrogenase [Thermoanaerobaculia bacterium]
MELNAQSALAAAIADKSCRVGIVGLGYVGLPLALAFCESGFSVLGFDVDAAKVAKLGAGENYIRHLAEDRLRQARAREQLEATADFGRLGEVDAILICVPTPLDRYRQPDLSYVDATVRAVAKTLRRGQLVILESTTYPGTTDELMKDILDESGLRCGEEYFLAYSPEREDPGNPDFGTREIPKVVGGVDPTSGELAENLYRQVIGKTVRVSSARTAEATKLLENIFRAVNIALVNELKVVYERMGIDVWEVLDAAATKPFGFMRFEPGPGWGGHCIPLDPFYLTWKAREYGISSRFVELAGEVNLEMQRYVVQRVAEALNAREMSVRGSRVLVLGLAYKPDIDDPRESPSFAFIDAMLKLGAEVSYHDPHVVVAPSMRSWPDLPPLRSVELTAEMLSAVDVAVLLTAHRAVDYELVARHASLIVDTRGVLPISTPNLVRA